jgi:DNA-binding cell septation regulator SpoVG
MDGEELQTPMVTEIRIQLTKEPPILAFASVTLWDAIVVHDLRVLQRRDGTTVVLMPRLPNPEGGWTTVAHPVREATRREIESLVVAAYEKEKAARLTGTMTAS